jgi:DnaJ-domain-containing protein 1
VSIGKRFVDLVRANINSLLERASSTDGGRSAPIENLSDEELEREMRRRRRRRTAAERAASSVEEQAWEEVEQATEGGTGRFRTTGPRTSSQRPSGYRSSPGTFMGRDPRLARLYAQLECPYGADMTTVRKHYRAMMRKYHPDMHSTEPHKQRIATELSQRLTMAYNELRRALSSN